MYVNRLTNQWHVQNLPSSYTLRKNVCKNFKLTNIKKWVSCLWSKGDKVNNYHFSSGILLPRYLPSSKHSSPLHSSHSKLHSGRDHGSVKEDVTSHTHRHPALPIFIGVMTARYTIYLYNCECPCVS